MTANEATQSATPKVGDGATIQYYSDRSAGTVIAVSPSGHRVTIQEDKATRTDGLGMTDSGQTYEYERDPDGRLFIATRRQDGAYRLAGSEARVVFGHRSKYYDFSF